MMSSNNKNATTFSTISSKELRDLELMQINGTGSGTLSSFSYDGTDLISFEDGTCATELSSRPSSTTSFLSDDLPPGSTSNHATRQKISINSNSSSSVYVMVSGTSFAVPRDAFRKLEKLQWRRDTNREGGVYHLNTSPAIFEVLLGHLVFETLPAYDTLSKTEYEDFEPMALSLNLYDLIAHFDRSTDQRLRRQSSSITTKRGRRSPPKRNKPHNKGIPIVLNNEHTSMTSMKLMAANSKCARFVSSLTRKGTSKLRSRRTKTTHDQWCASDHIN